jgi:hypothetical protein
MKRGLLPFLFFNPLKADKTTGAKREIGEKENPVHNQISLPVFLILPPA